MAVRQLVTNKEAICRGVLESLPDWFGIPSAIHQYAQSANELPMFVAETGGEIVGCLTLRRTAPESWDIDVIAVRQEHHRRRLGRGMIESAATYCRREGGRFLTVKTMGPSHEDAHYAATRRFYEATGFSLLEEFPNFWNGVHPMAIYIQCL